MRAVLVDAYDSFVHIIGQYLREAGIDVEVVRNDRGPRDAIEGAATDFVVLGPGPGHPADAGYVELVNRYGGRIPLLGICLGHQAIGLAFGGEIARTRPMHGKTSAIGHDGRGCFRHRHAPFAATRYHSLVVAAHGLPDCLEVTARAADDGCIMGLRHRALAIEGVQFHPESVCTDGGAALLRGFVETHVAARP